MAGIIPKLNELLPEEAPAEDANGEGASEDAKSPQRDDENLDDAGPDDAGAEGESESDAKEESSDNWADGVEARSSLRRQRFHRGGALLKRLLRL